MKAFSDYFTDPKYAKSYVKGEDCVGIVYIESEQDKAFWRAIFKQNTKNRYSFKTGTTKHPYSRSKSLFADMYTDANETTPIAIDSDFDYLAANRSEVAKNINANPYVLQTFAYSVESLDFEVNTLDQCLEKTQFYIEHEFTINHFLSRYSALIYPLLLRYLFLMDQRVDDLLDEKAFHRVLVSFDLNLLYFDNDWEDFTATVTELTTQLTSKVNKDELARFERSITLKGINKSNSYQFIHGHTLADSIVRPLIKVIRDKIKSAERIRIKAAFKGEDIQTRMNEMEQHFKTKCSFDTLVANSELKTKSPIYQKICSHLSSLIS